MGSNLTPIHKNSLVCKKLSSIPEKFVIDFANSIDINNDHIRVQKERSAFSSRLFDGLTGKSSRRQNQINKNTNLALESSLETLKYLTLHVAESNRVISLVNDRINNIKNDITDLGLYSLETRDLLIDLTSTLDFKINRIDLMQKVSLNIDQVFDKWRAGCFYELTPIQRCYAALEELRWGAFGEYCINNSGVDKNNFIEQLTNKAIKQLADDMDINTHTRLHTYKHWLQDNKQSDLSDGIAYLADKFDIEGAPLIITITSNLSDRSDAVPILATPIRIAETLVDEVFTYG